MPAPSEDEMVLFLVSCVRNTGDGKPDWKAVSNDRGIVSAHAAAKRWRRISEANPVRADKSSEAGPTKATPRGAPKGKVPKEKVPKEKLPREKVLKEKKASPRKKRKVVRGPSPGAQEVVQPVPETEKEVTGDTTEVTGEKELTSENEATGEQGVTEDKSRSE